MCNEKEIEIETWHQLINDSDFINSICTKNNITLKNIKIIKFKMWDSFKFKDGKMDTTEPKWANNVNTKIYRPNTTTPITNLFIGGAYTNTTTGIYSMEGATESGKNAAYKIFKKDNVKINNKFYIHKKKIFNNLLRLIDKFLYNNNISYYIIILLIILLIIIYKSIKK